MAATQQLLRRIARVALVVAFALVALGCGASNVQTGGYVAADGRGFWLKPKYPGQLPGNAVSLVAEPEVSIKTEDGDHALTARPFYRLDPIDERRSHADVRRADYRLSLEHLQVGAGVGHVSWGVLESYRPTDVVNQTDFVESPDGSAKLGQPYAELAWVDELASIRFYYLPYFRERTFPGLRGRLRFPVTIDTDSAQFESSLGPWQPSGAVRFAVSKGDLDLGLNLFTGLSREPRFIVELTSGSVAPRYDRMHQGSADVQWTVGPFVLKGEGFVRAWTDDLRAFVGGGAGIDYTFFKLFGESDLSLAGEFLFDTRPSAAAPTFFEHDAFAGLRFALNDTASTELLAGVITDVVDLSTFTRTQLARRFGDHWRLSVGANLFVTTPGKLEGSLRRDNHATARVAYFF
jgi:hypothetical protein